MSGSYDLFLSASSTVQHVGIHTAWVVSSFVGVTMAGTAVVRTAVGSGRPRNEILLSEVEFC
jgi:inner membrane protein involved in colicin E2 resistance